MSAVRDRIAKTPPVAERDATPAEREAFLAAVRLGSDPSTAAREFTRPNGTHRTATEFGRLANRDEEFSIAYAEALQEREQVLSDWADSLMRRKAEEEGAAPGIVVCAAAGFNPRFRRAATTRSASEDDPLASGQLPEIDTDRLTTAQVELLQSLLMMATGRIPNPELEQNALGPGETA